jgi:integrase
MDYRDSNVANKTVNIYERVKVDGKWRDWPVLLPKLKPDGKLYLKDDRDGKFMISWYEGRKKARYAQTFKTLSEALRVKVDKEWYLQNLHRGVQDPTLPDPRVPISVAINVYLDGLTGSKATKKAHRHDLREFEAWNEGLEHRKKKFVEEIDKVHMRRFFEYLVDDEPENCPFTAAWKLLRLNKFIRTVLHLDPGKGPIKKSDYKRELKRGEDPPEIYTRDELKVLFGVMTPDEVALFETLLKAGLRKQEVMFLEDDDLIVETLGPGLVRRDICVQSKPHWGFVTKNGKKRLVPIPADLMNKLLAVKAKVRPSKLLFGTSLGKPDYHILDTLHSIAKRAGFDPSNFWLHKFRSTCATNWLRSPKFGGKGYDIAIVRELLGHDDYKSIEAYLAYVHREELIEVDEPENMDATTADR